jgi:ubiquinone/menaquinone biosynthesis C-methylase UbiE
MHLLDDILFPRINDFALGEATASLRAEVAGGARGKTLEIGAGTGLNFRHYPAGAKVVAIEPAPGMHARAARRARAPEVRASVEVSDANALRLPFADAQFDTVVASFVLCSVKDLDTALAEVRRVLVPGGAFRLVEHVASPDPSMRAWQRRIRPVWTRLLGGCDPVRDVRAALGRAGFSIEGIRDVELPLPSIVRAGILGEALRVA